MLPYSVSGQKLWLSPQRCIYWEDQSALIVSDLHFGKTGHFRKSGIAVPQHVYKEDLQRLVSLIQYFKPGELIIAGDLFHSHMNQELELFKRWRGDLDHLTIRLIMGNHDILQDQWYKETGILVHEKTWEATPFLFCHDAADRSSHQLAHTYYSFTGHIHPGISIHGTGRQSLRFPCFYFTDNYCVLPAFSRFTGTYRIQPGNGDQVFAIVNNEILQLN